MTRPQDLTGQQFDRWTVLAFGGRNNGNLMWLCRCACGREKTVRQPHLIGGYSRSCGCLQSEMTKGKPNLRTRKHGMAHTREYAAWAAMQTRCYNPNSHSYISYGARGIVICAGWRQSFESFFAALGPRPSTGYSLDRVDNDAPYSCGNCPECREHGWRMNCRWATPKQQTNNRRDRSQWRAIGAVGAPGELNASARFTEADIRTIRTRYAAGGISQSALGKQYGVGQSIISAIVLRRKWRHVI